MHPHLFVAAACAVLTTAVAGAAAPWRSPGDMFDGRLLAVALPEAVVSADVDADGDIDLVVSGSAGPLAALLGTGDGGFADPVYGGTEGYGAVAVGNFDRDGTLDLVVTRAPDIVAVVPGAGDGAFAPPSRPVSLGARPAAVAVGDFDGDGVDDLAVTTHSYDVGETALWVVHNGGSTPEAHHPVRLAQWLDGAVDDHEYLPAVVAGDLNADGHLDLAAVQFGGGGVSLFLGTGEGGFTAPSRYGIEDPVTAMVMSDLDGDGAADLAVTTVPWTGEFDAGTVQVMAGRGDGTLGPPSVHRLPTAPYSLAAADFDGDGAADLAVANPYAGSVSVLLGRGLGAFAAPRHQAAATWPMSVAAGDVDGDGRADLVATSDEGVWVLRSV